MFFIAGAGEDAIEVEHGNFNCPQCDQVRRYVRKRISSHVSAFFVPVWRSSGGSEFVECQTCGSQFDSGVLTADFERNQEIIRLTDVARESGTIALESRDPTDARSHYNVSMEAYRLALALRPNSSLYQEIDDARKILADWFPSSLCMNEALGIFDKANNHGNVTEQLPLLYKAKNILEDGLAQNDIGHDDIMSIYKQVVPYVQEAEALSEKQRREAE